MIVGSIKEDLSLEKRVSITPETAKNIINLGLKICIEKDYATHLGIKDSEYKDVGVEIKNLSWWGAGNQFIAGNCFDYVQDNHVDYVYVQFSGLARFDIPTHDTYNIPDYEYTIKTYKRKYVVSGGKNGSWTGNDRTNQIFLPLYWKDEQYDHIAQESIQACASAIWFLKNKNITV